jgi:nucleotide-binding universal stress UspA family protein
MTEGAAKRKPAGESGSSGSGALRSVLVPIDLTPSSDRVLGRLSLLPLADDARVTLVHVVPGNLPHRDQRSAERDALHALVAEVRHARKTLSGKVSIEPLVLVGAPAKAIGACATHVKAELIVMGRGQGSALRDAFLGSTAERVIRQAQLPVLVIRLPPRAAYRRPALALDFDEAAHDVVRLMLILLPPPRPRVTVIHAYDTPYGGMIYQSLSKDEAHETKKEFQLRATQELAKLLAGALAQGRVPNEDAPSWKAHVRYGSARYVVAKTVRKMKPDLLVLGTHGYSGAAYVCLGTVAGDLLREAKCDVLVVPPVATRHRALTSREAE